MSATGDNGDNIRRDNGIACNDGRRNGSTGTAFIDENYSLAEGSGSDDCGDKLMAKESDPLQPKLVKSRSMHKFREVKEVSGLMIIRFPLQLFAKHIFTSM